ncbi:MAG: hypothetical protein ING19_20660 [Azospirillum sp.]|nr:hypothetical protein [Azospirillum sp.]
MRAHADRGFENGKPGRNAPDYTFAAIVAGCDWKDAKISDDHPAALRDAKNGRLGKGLSWLMTSVAVGAGISIPLDSLGIADMAVQMVGYAGVSIVAVPLVKVATDAIVDALKKGAGDIQENAFDRLRHKIETARVFFAHKKDTLLAFVHRVKAPTVVQAMRAMSRPGEKLGFFDVVGSRDVHLVIADSKNFRVAFQHLILRQDVGRTYRDDVSIMLAEDDEHAPRAMRFMKDGSCAAVWYEGGMPAYVASFDASGAFDPDRSFLPDEIEPPTREEVLEYFQEAVLRHSDAPVPPKTGRFMRLDIDRNGNPIRLPPRAPDVTVTPVRPETVFVDGLENENAESAESERKIVDFNAMAARRSAGPH